VRGVKGYAAIGLLGASLLAGCQGSPALGAGEQGGLGGAAVGAGTGALIGGATGGSVGAGALLGSGGGARGGYLLGDRIFEDDPSRRD
jgi:hypothetical protein